MEIQTEKCLECSDLERERKIWWKYVRGSALKGLLPLTAILLLLLFLLDYVFFLVDVGEIIFMIFGIEPLFLTPDINLWVLLFFISGSYLALIPYVYASVGAYPTQKSIKKAKKLREAYNEYISSLGDAGKKDI